MISSSLLSVSCYGWLMPILLATLLLIAITHRVACRQSPEGLVTLIDPVFADWTPPAYPDGAVGTMKNGQLVLASLKYEVPNTPGTAFIIASVSRQFTAFSILLKYISFQTGYFIHC